MTDHKGQPVTFWGGAPAPDLSAYARELLAAAKDSELGPYRVLQTEKDIRITSLATAYLAAVAEVERLRTLLNGCNCTTPLAAGPAKGGT